LITRDVRSKTEGKSDRVRLSARVMIEIAGRNPEPRSTAEVLRPRQAGDHCGAARAAPLSDECGRNTFTERSAGKTVDQFLATLPRSMAASLDPGYWFPNCRP
jgi:hypothetical protein